MIQCHCETFGESNSNIKIYPNFPNSHCSLKLKEIHRNCNTNLDKSATCAIIIKIQLITGREMVQQLRALAAEYDGLSFIPGTHMLKGVTCVQWPGIPQ